jgi:hypothetical protein
MGNVFSTMKSAGDRSRPPNDDREALGAPRQPFSIFATLWLEICQIDEKTTPEVGGVDPIPLSAPFPQVAFACIGSRS